MAKFLSDHIFLALLSLAIEAAAGYPRALFERIRHPASWIGYLIGTLDRLLNRDAWPSSLRRAAGVFATAAIVIASIATGSVIQDAAFSIPFGLIPLAAVSSSLLAQRSLYEHVKAVADALDASLAEGRECVSKIVGRDVSALDEAGVSRAAIESLAENFSDGVVAPALWLAVLGLPGALAYKAVNTADSMIGHRSPRYEAFGWAAARLDDLLNLPASRLSAAFLALAAAFLPEAHCTVAFRSMWRDAGKHRSPNAGWPEAAMAGALSLRLGGPRSYFGEKADGAWLGEGRAEAGSADIRRALTLYRAAVALLWLSLAAAAYAAVTVGA